VKRIEVVYIYTYECHNETHQTIWKRGKRQRGNGNIMEGVKLFKVYCMHVWNYEIPSY
jgi:hypothetical protein